MNVADNMKERHYDLVLIYIFHSFMFSWHLINLWSCEISMQVRPRIFHGMVSYYRCDFTPLHLPHCGIYIYIHVYTHNSHLYIPLKKQQLWYKNRILKLDVFGRNERYT